MKKPILSMFIIVLAGACVPPDTNKQPPVNVTTPEAQMKAENNNSKDRVVIEILEKKRSFPFLNSIKFSIKSAEVLHGKEFVSKGKLKKGERKNIEKLINEYQYILEVYSAKKELLSEYVIASSRFVLWDNFENQTGGIDEASEGVIQHWLEYDKANPICFLRITDYKGKKTKLLPVVIKEKER